VVVHSMDRLARNLDDLRRLVQSLTHRGVRIEFVKESLTFTGEDSPMANLMLSVMGAFAEFERAMLRERTRTGLDAARQQGRIGGRRAKLTPQQQKEVIDLVTSGRKTGADAARLFRVHPSTVVRLLAKHRHETAT